MCGAALPQAFELSHCVRRAHDEAHVLELHVAAFLAGVGAARQAEDQKGENACLLHQHASAS
jgi:hypothetical protein